MRFVRLIAAAMVLGLAFTGVGLVSDETKAQAASVSQFDPGNIISDALFYDGGAMTASQVQSFLNSQVSRCSAGYTCLKDFSMATRSIPAVAGRCAAYASSGTETAATIIAKVGAACNISQKALLVTLQKEQALVTAASPEPSRFTIAMGFGCPDTAPCNTEYYGFQNQMYRAALQFQVYLHNPTLFGHGPFRYNTVRYHPTAACGSSQVYIQNNATAGLYNYTPYQPNAAAMANLYGTGDGCSSYGNRNFWRIYTDWFGSTTVSSLVRTPENGTVYLTAGTQKYSLNAIEYLAVFAALGPVSYVSQSYLDGFTNAGQVSRNLRSPNGTIYFTDSSIKLPYTSCSQMADYGGSCSPDSYVQLTEPQIAAFHSGPTLTSVLATTQGTRYFISGGQKREVLDRESLTAAGISTSEVVLTEAAVSHLAVGQPVMRSSVYLRERETGGYFYTVDGIRYPIANADVAELKASTFAVGALSAASLSNVPQSSTAFTGLVTAPDGSRLVLTNAGRYQLPAGSAFSATSNSVPGSSKLVDAYPLRGSLGAGQFFKTATNGTVFVVMPTDVRPISSWGALLALSPTETPQIETLPSGAAAAVPQGPVALTAGSLYRTADDATVYLINGVTSRIAFSSFAFTTAAGFSQFAVTSGDRLGAYPLDSKLLTYGIDCSGAKFVSASGQVHKVRASEANLFPFTFVSLDSFTCAKLNQGAEASNFMRLSDGSIYQLVGGEKRPVSSMARFSEISDGRPWLEVDGPFAAMIPTGPYA